MLQYKIRPRLHNTITPPVAVAEFPRDVHYKAVWLPIVQELDGWIRRRVRLHYWKAWKNPRTRRRHLIALGIGPEDVRMASRSRKG